MNEQTSEEAVILWADRHGLQGTIMDLKCAFEDAATLYESKRCEEMEKRIEVMDELLDIYAQGHESKLLKPSTVPKCEDKDDL